MSKNPPARRQDPPPSAQQDSAPELQPTQIDRFLDLQAQELALRAQEMTLRKQEIANTHEYTQAALQAQLQDREAERTYRRRTRREWYIFMWLLLAALLGAVLYMLYIDKDQFAGELLKAVLYVVPAAAGGYFAGKQKGKADKVQDEEE